MAIQITIPITPVTKKNHQQIMRSSKTGKPFVMPSAEYRQYEAQAVWHCKRAAISAGVHKPIDTPCEVWCLFYMPSRRRVDLIGETGKVLCKICGCLCRRNAKSRLSGEKRGRNDAD